tara:strand:+ start:93 stop:302 length:210 start_codon:yes stop_codon:yes gene_type:complete
MGNVREHRVSAFCNWLDTIPPDPPFHAHPAFRFYRDLTDAEFWAAQKEMKRRADAAMAEADALEREARK